MGTGTAALVFISAYQVLIIPTIAIRILTIPIHPQ